jgi:hypothetical protein
MAGAAGGSQRVLRLQLCTLELRMHREGIINLPGMHHTVRSLISGKSFLLTHCHKICIRKEISRPGFLDVSRYRVVHSIDLRRVFFALRKYFDVQIWWQCVMPGVVWWVVWAESPIQI